MVRRLLQRLDQVVSVLRIYGPQRAFAYALKDRRDERDVIGSAVGAPQRKTQTECEPTSPDAPNTSSKSRPGATVPVYQTTCAHSNGSHIPPGKITPGGG